jgi:hypothetical protein
MPWGFDIPDSWEPIIRSACRVIQSHIDWSRSDRARALRFNRALKRALLNGDRSGLQRYYSGRSGEITEWHVKMIDEVLAKEQYQNVPAACPQVVAVQVKSKFGSLRFYVNGGDDYTRGVISMAEAMSAVTCEECGASGKLRDDGWVSTLCDTHAVEQGHSLDDEEDDDL